MWSSSPTCAKREMSSKQGRAVAAAGTARLEVDRHLVAGDEPAPAAFVQQVEEAEAALDHAISPSAAFKQPLAVAIEDQPDEAGAR
jgi:hypothetical protein